MLFLQAGHELTQRIQHRDRNQHQRGIHADIRPPVHGRLRGVRTLALDSRRNVDFLRKSTGGQQQHGANPSIHLLIPCS